MKPVDGGQAVKKRKSLPPHWYKHYVWECPICGRGGHIRERQFSPPPPKYSQERWDYDGMAYDWCDVL